jgi:hypothetical protein
MRLKINNNMTIDQNILISVQAGKISTGRAKELIEAEIQRELEALAKECIGRGAVYSPNSDPEYKPVSEGYNLKRQEVIEAFKRWGINI